MVSRQNVSARDYRHSPMQGRLDWGPLQTRNSGHTLCVAWGLPVDGHVALIGLGQALDREDGASGPVLAADRFERMVLHVVAQ